MHASRGWTGVSILAGIALSLALALAGCDSGGGTEPEEGTIGEAGGTATLAGGAVVLSVPAGALSSSVTLTATPSSSGPSDDKVVGGSGYDIGPSGTVFAQPVTVTIKYDVEEIPEDIPEGELRLYKAVGSEWEIQEDAGVSTLTHSVFGKTSGLSLFAARALDVSTVQVSPTSADLEVGGTAQLSATPKAEDGTTLVRPVTWSSSAPSVASVDASGSVSALAEGSATITATSEGVNGTATVTVTIPVASVDVTPEAATINAGETAQLTATPKDASGNALARTVSWSSSDDGVATVDDDGLVTGVAEGTATITASSEGESGTATITVNDPVDAVQVSPATSALELNETVQLTATVLGATGNVLSTSVTWATSNGGIATVSGTGLVTATGEGTATITATAAGVDGTATVTVTIPVASVDVTPAVSTLNVLETVQLTATPKDANGNPLTRTVTWSSSDEDVATVDANGLVTGQGAGQATITATAEDAAGVARFGEAGTDDPARTASGTAMVTVNDPVTTVEVTPAQTSLTAGATVQLTATAKGAKGNEITGKTATWQSSNEAAATVDGDGLVTAVAGGTATITATIDGVDGTAQITVTFDITAFEGNWTGNWTNTTFGSSGAAVLQVLLFQDTNEIEFTWDLDGFVFGGTDPPADTFNGTYTDTGFTVNGVSPTFGTVTLTGNADGFTGSGTNVPAAGIASVTFTGTFSPTAIHFDYTVNFTAGGQAFGTIDLTKS